MSATQAFDVGDKVLARGHAGEITYGPLDSTFGVVHYAVTMDMGREMVYRCTDLVLVPPAPAFAIGDTVSTTYAERAKVVAGPFTQRHGGTPWWVIQVPDGTHGAPNARGMALVEASPATRIWVVGDVYRDREGDDVKVARTPRGKIVLNNTWHDNPIDRDPTPEEYAADYGPLIKIS